MQCNPITKLPVLQIFGLQYLDRHCPPSSDVLPLNLKKSAVTTSPELHRSGGRRRRHTKIRTAAARDVAPSATHGRAQEAALSAHRAASSGAPRAPSSPTSVSPEKPSPRRTAPDQRRNAAQRLHKWRPHRATSTADLLACGGRGAQRSDRSPSATRCNMARRAEIHDRPPCAGQGQRSRAMRDQRASVARDRARGEDDEAPPYAAARWPGVLKEYLAGNSCLAPTGITRMPALHGIQLAVDPQPLWLRNHNSGLAHRIMVKRLPTSPHDPLGITDSACKNQLVVVSVQYGPFNPYIPIRSTTIGKSRVAKDPIAMHTSWRSNSDIASVTSIGYPRMSASGESSTTMHRLLHASGSHPIPMPYDPKTNQYNQDLGLIHSTNGNHLESPKEGSSIDHQVTIYLHAQNITMLPTNETWYFASQILVSNSGGLILILTAQSTRNSSQYTVTIRCVS
ncbi:hypothetical protein F511_33000 [Dorcoceras hygrometricum]|uniref:Uncharacterized protein n=1 Tax=Dorcoceras hygrometricum TaxID=472368 RepID=A0A2Z7CZ33_9LAMI|nr:hypothetical protein F511_33000 [Dorcoceras hygrometricum]